MDADKILISDELDVLFDGRNKAYGAYNLRKTYNERLMLAMFITLIMIMLMYLVSVLSNLRQSDKENEFLVKDISLSQVKKDDKLLPPPPPPPKLPPPPPKVEMIKFTTPKVVKDADVPNDVKPPEISKIDEARISTINQAGQKDMGIIAPPDAPVESKGTQVVEKPEEDYVFTKVEKQAEFPGGEVQWRRYLEKNLNPNIPIDNNAPEGTYTVVIRFIVGKDGSIRNVEAETSFGYGMEEEASRVIRNGPKWTPALQNGLFVTAYRRQPVTFVIQTQ